MEFPYSPLRECEDDCPGAPKAYWYTDLRDPSTKHEKVREHFHRSCWMCGADIISKFRVWYDCACGYEEGPAGQPETEIGWDGGDLATRLSSPG